MVAKGRLVTHGIWVVMAAVSFVVGAVFFPEDAGRVEIEPGIDGGVVVRGGSEVPTGGGVRRSGGGVSSGGAVGVKSVVLSDLDIEALGETFRTAGSPVEKRLAFSKLLAGLTAENALLVREQIADMDHRSGEFQEFHYAWGAVAGADAALFGADTEEDDMSPALAGWASADADAALAWFGKLDMESNPAFDALLKERKIPVNDLKNHLIGGLVRGVAANDPGRAAGMVEELVEGGNHAGYGMMRSVVDAVLRGGTGEAAEWAEEVANDKLRYVAMEQVAGRMVRKEFEKAIEWAASVADKPEGGGVVAHVGGAMARKDPGEAMVWLGGLPDGSGKSQGIGRAMWQWTARDAAAASDYLSTMDVGGARDSAVGAFSRRLAEDDPQTAVSWAETMDSDKGRIPALIHAGQAWSRRDMAGALDWVVGSGLPEEVQLKILTPEVKR